MKTFTDDVLVVSDIHLTNTFDVKKFQFLQRILKKAPTVVINGDFIDRYVASFAEIESVWGKLFDILKEKQTYYLPGNHDAGPSGKIYQRFAQEQRQYLEFMQNGQLFHLEHGHAAAPYLDSQTHLPKWLLWCGSMFDRVMARLFGDFFLCIYKIDNDRMKRWQKTHLSPDAYLICGHSHWAEVSDKEKYANSGLVNSGFGQYLIISDGKVTGCRERY